MINSKISLLPWDTDFFGVNVYKIEASTDEDVTEALKHIKRPAMAYVFAKNAIEKFNPWLKDVKMSFEQSLDSVIQTGGGNCVLYNGANAEIKDLEHLAIVSSGNSRFRKDDKIPVERVDKLFKIWIHSSMNLASGKNILLKIVQEKVAGLISFRGDKDALLIELVAVGEEFQRQGYARDLMSACFRYGKENNYNKIKVVTQEENAGACSFYRQCGFINTDVQYIYHLHFD